MADSSSFRAAMKKLEDQMTDKQKRWVDIKEGKVRYSSLSTEKDAIELLESEIEDRKNAIERLEAQSCCDCCGAQGDVPEAFRIRLTTDKVQFLTTKLKIDKVRIRAECADCWRKYDLQQRPDKVVATREDIDRAIESWWECSQRKTLQNFADYRARNLGRTSYVSSGEDLVDEALVATLEGAQNTGAGKHWNKTGVDFLGHLKFAILNISGNLKRQSHGKRHSLAQNTYSEAEVIRCDEEGKEPAASPLDIDSDNPSVVALAPWLPRPAPRPDKSLIANEEIERKHKIFANNKEASAVFDAQLEGVTTAREIMQEQRLTRRQYDAAQRRIRSQKSALIIEEDDQVLELMARWLEAMDFAVVATGTTGEGQRIYRECGPFGVVIVSCSLDLNCVELAMNIRKRSPSQNMIITTPFSSEEDVVRPSELAHVPILLKPFRKTEFRAALESFVSSAKEEPANRCRQKRRKVPTFKIRTPLRIDRASKLPKRDGIHSTTPTS